MRKFILALMAVAMLAIPASASAAGNVERCQVTTTVPGTSVTTATFTVYEPRGTKDDFAKVWTSDYKVDVSTDGKSFNGVGNLTDGEGIDVPLLITGTFNSDGTISYEAKPVGDTSTIVWVLVNGKTDGSTVNAASTLDNGSPVATNVKVTLPVLTTVKGADVVTTTEYKNHGAYVSSLGGGKVAAQACVGIPTVSVQGKL